MGTWLRPHPVRGGTPATARLVCLPHAGGTASAFAGWPARLPPGVEMLAVQYPGRQDRLAEPVVTDMHEMADRLAAELRGLLDLPMTLFGHSMGSGLAYEVAGRLERESGFVMNRLFVSARTAPHRIDGEHRHRLTDEELVAAMRHLGGPDAAVYDHPQLLPLILPPLRSDLRLLDAYLPDDVTPLKAPVTAFGGDRDDTCPVAGLSAWQDATAETLEVRSFPGGHHYLRENEEAVVEAVSPALLPHR
ncbi:thioesterase domain-containing protein [Streptomyces sp. TRM 70351]|uniref:thioesterase II family protein n=1 Tax=Streptomyces sp. TRM 70351 TaxID=3116552 RepID=UPI002E7ADAAE|nr:thioesterase domain-containing protein [Streptomyces sp. TRM 70351]MEE1927327.1 thioesterase domain-containing protein [Streptomyces sp. TRM 70351]